MKNVDTVLGLLNNDEMTIANALSRRVQLVNIVTVEMQSEKCIATSRPAVSGPYEYSVATIPFN